MSPTQAKIALSAAVALLAWLLTKRATAAPVRVRKEFEVEANVLNPNFGLTEEEIAAQKAGARANPAIDPEMRRLIDLSNIVIAEDDAA